MQAWRSAPAGGYGDPVHGRPRCAGQSDGQAEEQPSTPCEGASLAASEPQLDSPLAAVADPEWRAAPTPLGRASDVRAERHEPLAVADGA